jgi:putative mRNA 3-end processing factor
MALIEFSDKGLYCPAGDFYIDPWRGVNRAIITHAHSDHARMGSNHYLCHHLTKPLLQLRLGDHVISRELNGEKQVTMNGVKISLHPAGHIIGSSQVRVEHKGEVWVVSGDYKTENPMASVAISNLLNAIHSLQNPLSGYPFINGNRNRNYLQISSNGSKKINRRQNKCFNCV